MRSLAPLNNLGASAAPRRATPRRPAPSSRGNTPETQSRNRPKAAAHRTVPSSDDVIAVNRSVGCHVPPVSPLTWPFVLRASRMYMSPRTNSPFSRPSRSYIFWVGCLFGGGARVVERVAWLGVGVGLLGVGGWALLRWACLGWGEGVCWVPSSRNSSSANSAPKPPRRRPPAHLCLRRARDRQEAVASGAPAD